MTLSHIQNVLILGAGTMGQQIGLLCAMHGYNVALHDQSSDILDESFKRIQKLGNWFVSIGRLDKRQLQDTLSRIQSMPDPREAGKDADFVSESLPENPDLKGRVFAAFNEICPERTIFTTNTSTLLPSMFADKTGRPDRFAALHFHDVRTSNLVDVMPHPGTAPETVELIRDFAKGIGQVAIVLQRENSGYVFNAMLSSLFTSALTLASKGVASIEDIDRSWMGIMHTPIGPFGIMDQVGLSTVWTITDYWAGITGDPQLRANADLLKRYLDQNRLGFKSMRGFYSYPNPEYAAQGFLSGESEHEE